jgi:hypothetical protein
MLKRLISKWAKNEVLNLTSELEFKNFIEFATAYYEAGKNGLRIIDVKYANTEYPCFLECEFFNAGKKAKK